MQMNNNGQNNNSLFSNFNSPNSNNNNWDYFGNNENYNSNNMQTDEIDLLLPTHISGQCSNNISIAEFGQ